MVTIRELEQQELVAAYAVMRELRQHLGLQQFQDCVARQRRSGYRLLGGFDAKGKLLAVLGMRPVSTLARGDHLHIDDLVVTERKRCKGIGKAMLRHAECWAQEQGLVAVFLDSRQDAVRFYSALGYQPHAAVLMRKRIDVS
ncbi:MAG: hypothetical protein K0R43_846 [Pseudoduganella sp.]|jgi:GNAT superfamily N-acetyltransferase|nr:hypothetical protein [Pseudoduganella sp.]